MGKNGRANKHASKHTERSSDLSSSKASTTKKVAPKSQPKKDVSNKEEEEERARPTIPVELQQLLLGIFKDSFHERLEDKRLQEVLQEVKGALYKRDFAAAFGKEEYLEAYCVRWSPSRALGYAEILVELKDYLKGLQLLEPGSSSDLDVVCFGGCAAEVIAFGGLIKTLDLSSPEESPARDVLDLSQELSHVTLEKYASSQNSKINLTLIDSANWQQVIQKLEVGLTTLPTLPKYANAAAREANAPLLKEGDLSTAFRCEDVLDLSLDQLGELAGERPILFTLLFTLNELYTSSIPKTTAFLLKLTTTVKPGTLLLVVDSPGSYSETTLGSGMKQYPMHWLLDHTLVPSKSEEDEKDDKIEKKQPEWEKVVSETSKWFRIPEGMRYPIPLENMRYQMHLYRRI